MKITRRGLIKTTTALPIASIALAQAGPIAAAAPSLPDKESFEKMGFTYLNNASQHPISFKSSAEAETYLAKRRLNPKAPKGLHDSNIPLENFAKLINADFDEVAYVQSTSAGEQMVARGLGFPESGGHIITDEFHFHPSLIMYDWMSHNGMDVTRIEGKNNRIDLNDIKAALRPDTKLIALSLVAMETGFKHDLKAVCEIAHKNGTLVYADIVQAAGTVPIDVRDCGIDFAACSSYKWLMGDFGTGFIYASKAAQSRLTRTNFGYFGLNTPSAGKAAEEARANYGFPNSASGLFAIGTRSFSGVAILKQSLTYILEKGVENIHAYSKNMTDHLKAELPKIGYNVITPNDSDGPMVVVSLENADKILKPRMDAANIQIALYPDRFRISPSIFNDMADIDKLLKALKGAV
ncbi:MAG: aminotransferase class V-fold PLP-dependent enzyme [Kordiimonadaceae bacterium]|nr:aminotransferase class V-fold PLP-dependent enzyme [Kordiimonadaceae bacterium]